MRNKKCLLGVGIMTIVLGLSAFSLVNAKSDGGNGAGQNDKPGMPGGKNGGFAIMAEAIYACSGKSENDACSFTMAGRNNEEKSIEGKCLKNPKDKSELACMPERNQEKERERAGETKGFGFDKAKENNGEKTELERAQEMKQRKEAAIARIENRAEKIITFLQSKDIDTETIESNLVTFKSKADALVDKIDELIALLEGDDVSQDSVKTARENIKTSAKDMMDYFQNTLRASIQSALDQISE